MCLKGPFQAPCVREKNKTILLFNSAIIILYLLSLNITVFLDKIIHSHMSLGKITILLFTKQCKAIDKNAQ